MTSYSRGAPEPLPCRFWSSKAARDEFMQTRVGPAVAASAITAEPAIEELRVHVSLTQEASARV
jgi:hypothetical protein